MALANHLLNDIDNDHVTLHELRGFVADDLKGALKETHAISKGTRCKQFLFSLSLNPPETERVPIDVFEKAVVGIERKLGLSDQPRAIVFHEKEGRRHAHAIWSRIDAVNMRSINLPYFKMKLRDESRDLYLENGWQMPPGLMDQSQRNLFNFSLVEWQQTKRAKINPKIIKKSFRECWLTTDNREAFALALEQYGYFLARGDRRGHVAVDWRGEVYSIARYCGVKFCDVRTKLGDEQVLPSIADAKRAISKRVTAKISEMVADLSAHLCEREAHFEERRSEIRKHQRDERQALKQQQSHEQNAELTRLASRLPTGVRALWFRLTGAYIKIRTENELATGVLFAHHQKEHDDLLQRQPRERKELQHEKREMTRATARLAQELQAEFGRAGDQPFAQKNRNSQNRNGRMPTRDFGR